MVGNKNSGDKTRMEKEVKRVAIDLMWVNAHKLQCDSEVSIIDKVKYATPIIAKTVAQDVNLGGQPNNPLGITLEIVLNEDRTDKASNGGVQATS